MNRGTNTAAWFLASCLVAGCVSFQHRNDDPSSAWNTHFRRSQPEPKQPHLELYVDRKYVLLSVLRELPPEARHRPVADIVGPCLRMIEAELNGQEIHAVWSNRLGIAASDAEWPRFRISCDMKYLLWQDTRLSSNAVKLASRRAGWYACVRLAGFSTSYAMRSQSEGFVHPPDGLPERAQATLRNHPHVPPGLLRADRGASESGDQHEEYYVLDNGLAWFLNSEPLGLGEADFFWVYPTRRDAQEFDPALAEAFASARHRAQATGKEKGIVGMSACDDYEHELQTILKDEYGIKWRSLSELNPHIIP